PEEARPAARGGPGVAFVPLSEQATALWCRAMMVEAEQLLAAAAPARRIGRFQLEAAIQSGHAERARSGAVDWAAIVQLYDGLATIAPSVGALLGRAAAIAQMDGAERALAAVDEIAPASVAMHQPYWALRGHLLQRLGRAEEAKAAYERAIGLTEDLVVRDFLIGRVLSVGCSG